MPNRGELEQRVMELLWAAQAPMTVADVQNRLNDADRSLAYTTVMTVLDRLAKKDLLTRQRVDRAWHYQPAEAQDVVLARELREVVQDAPEAVRQRAVARFLAEEPNPATSPLV